MKRKIFALFAAILLITTSAQATDITGAFSSANFGSNNEIINITSSGDIANTSSDYGIAANSGGYTGLTLNVNAAADKGISGDAQAVIIYQSNLSELNLNSGRITGGIGGTDFGTISLLEVLDGITSINLAANTSITNTSSDGGMAIKYGNTTNSGGLSITNSGTISSINHADSNAIYFNDSDGGSTLSITNNNVGIIDAGTNGTAINVLSSNSATIINNGTITGAIKAESGDIDISGNGTITGNINLGSNSGSSITLETGSSVTSDVTFGNSAQTLTVNGGYLTGALVNAGNVFIASGAGVTLTSSTLDASIDGVSDSNGGSIGSAASATITTNSNIGSTHDIGYIYLNTDVTFNADTNNNSINLSDSGNISLDSGAVLNLGTGAVNGNIQSNTTGHLGTINFKQNNSLGGNIGIGSFGVNTVNISAAKTLNTGAYSINASNINIGSDAILNLGDGSIIGNSNDSSHINGSADNAGTINTSGTVIIYSDIGQTHRIDSLNINAGSHLYTFADILAADVTLNGQFDFAEDGSSITGDVTGGGTGVLNLGYSTNTINGNLTLTAGDTIAMGITNTIESGTVIITSGVASISANTKLTVAIGSDVTPGSKYVIVSGTDGSTINAISSSNIDVANSGTNRYGSYIYTASVVETDLVLDVARYSVTINGANSQQTATYNYINNISNASGNLLNMQNYLNSSDNSDASKTKALNSATAQTDNSSNRVAFNNIGVAANLIAGRLNAGLSSNATPKTKSFGDEEVNKSTWMQTFGSIATQKDTADGSGYKAGSAGLAIGFDKKISSDFTLGFAGIYSNSSVKSSDDTKKTKINSYQANLYGGYSFEQYFINALIGVGFNKYNANRTISSVGVNARSNYDGRNYVARTEAGLNHHFENGAILTPSLALTAAQNRVDQYQESGAGSLNLNVKNDPTNFFEGRIGSTLSRDYKPSNNKTITPNFTISYGYDFAHNTQKSTTSFVGQNTALESSGSRIARGSLILGTGVKLLCQDRFVLSLDYNFEQRSKYQAHLGYLKGKYNF